MIGQWGFAFPGMNGGMPFAAAMSLAVLLSFGESAFAQQPQQPGARPAQAQSQPQAQPQPAQPAPAPKKDGFFDALGRWWDQSAADFNTGVNKMKGQIEDLNQRTAKAAREAVEATKEATDALVKLPSTRIVEGRERCGIAPNGSPDCAGAAETICRGKGFTSGKTANIESARKCSARALLSRSDEDCSTETIVTRAACQ